jgi:hypothetical protein
MLHLILLSPHVARSAAAVQLVQLEEVESASPSFSDVGIMAVPTASEKQ